MVPRAVGEAATAPPFTRATREGGPVGGAPHSKRAAHRFPVASPSHTDPLGDLRQGGRLRLQFAGRPAGFRRRRASASLGLRFRVAPVPALSKKPSARLNRPVSRTAPRRRSSRRLDGAPEPAIRQAPDPGPVWAGRQNSVNKLLTAWAWRALFPAKSTRGLVHRKAAPASFAPPAPRAAPPGPAILPRPPKAGRAPPPAPG